MMNKFISLVAGFVLALSLFVTTPEAATSGGLYDMSRFVDEPHPFAKTPVSPRLSIEKPLVRPKFIEPNKNTLNVISSKKKPEKLGPLCFNELFILFIKSINKFFDILFCDTKPDIPHI